MLSAIHRFIAPDRYPVPAPPMPPESGDPPEVLAKKVRMQGERIVQSERRKAWLAKVYGWHKAVICFSGANLALLLYTLFWQPISGQLYGLSLVAITNFMSVCAKRLVR